MPVVFFDLETSDREFIGQILNFAFIQVDDKLNPIGEYSGDVKLSCLQLPSAGAILANQVNVLEHQKSAKLSERDFCMGLFKYFNRLIEESKEPIKLIGFNSDRFDIPYLRTILIRNGLNPYFNGKLIYRDLYSATKKLSVTASNFPRVKAKSEQGKEERLSLKLETISQSLGLLSGSQEHNSRADVLLTIDLAKTYLKRYGLDIRIYEGYHGLPFHSSVRSGAVFSCIEPQYDLSLNSSSETIPYTLLDCDSKYALWINLKRFAEEKGSRGAISYYKVGGSSLVISQREKDPKESTLANEALKIFRGINIRNFFSTSICDIEQDIYRIDFDGIDALHQAIWMGNKTLVKNQKNRDVAVLYSRNMLANYVAGSGDDEAFHSRLKDYANYRYGGKLILSKNEDSSGMKPLRRHLTYLELLSEIDAHLADTTNSKHEILLALKQYYQNSLIIQVAGEDLTQVLSSKVVNN